MGYTIELLPDEPIIIETWQSDYNPETDSTKAAQEIISLMDQIGKPVTVIVDMRAKTLSFDDLVLLAKKASSEDAPAQHPNQRRRIIVTDSEAISLAAKGLNSEVFGHLAVELATSMEEALAAARK